ncbi:serine carboxypeptidase-like [Tripterygium wilfordii]|uniref:serine carboxypeptidase-like n=1 Tax=Tripterygium wilfordii TaxID=458696 RepID=UPI0018F8049D|nr:serine carboxypeptidase-like [Tripterygium wilfordii]
MPIRSSWRGEKARRCHYFGTTCAEFQKDGCMKGDSSGFAHDVFECWLHPAWSYLSRIPIFRRDMKVFDVPSVTVIKRISLKSNFLPSTTLNSSKQETKEPITSPDLLSQDDNNTFKDNSSTLRFIQRKFRIHSLPVSEPLKFLAKHASYIPLPDTTDERMFYFFFHSRNDKTNDPFILWLSGGPGASGSAALFYENGPFTLQDDFSLVENAYSWDKMSNILFVDQPMGTGYSHISNDNDLRHDLNRVINDLYIFLQEFFKVHHDFSQNDFFIIGQSYAGHYAPALAARIESGNNYAGRIHIKLKGIAIGNGHTNPKIQYPTIPEYAKSHDIITEEHDSFVKNLIPRCESSIVACEKGNEETGDEDPCANAFDYCSQIIKWIRKFAPRKNFGNIGKDRDGPSDNDFSTLDEFLNAPSIKRDLSVGTERFVSLNPKVFSAMKREYMKNLDYKIAGLLEDQERRIKVLIYVGDQDLINNFIGNERWVTQMVWYGKEEFNRDSSEVDFVVDGMPAGSMRKYGPLTFIKVSQAGHMVPMDQPRIAFKMIQNWMQTEINE